ncbi:MAG: glycosyltransferase family 4 protein [Pseudomonadota bacterium]
MKSVTEKRLRIAVLNRVFSPTGGGAERYSIALVEQLASRHEIHVFAQQINHQWPGVTYHKLWTPLVKPRWINQLWFAATTWWATRQGFDIVHSHENTWHGQVQTVHVLPIKYTLFKDRRGWRLALRWLKVLTSPRLLVYLWMERLRYAIRGGRRIVLTSTSLQSIMAQTYPAALSAMSVVTPGVICVPGVSSVATRREARLRLGLPQEGTCILFVGNDYRKKGLLTLIQALKQLPDDYFLAVVGNAAQIPGFREQVQASGLQSRIFFLGALHDVSDAYLAANCLAHPTLEDTFAMVVLEAMAHGLPVVVSSARYCGISDSLLDGVSALILEDPQDANALAEAIKRLNQNPVLSTSLSQSACTFAKSHLWSEVALRQEQVYFSNLGNVQP